MHAEHLRAEEANRRRREKEDEQRKAARREKRRLAEQAKPAAAARDDAYAFRQIRLARKPIMQLLGDRTRLRELFVIKEILDPPLALRSEAPGVR